MLDLNAILAARIAGGGAGGSGGGASSWNDLTDKPFYSEMVFAPLLEETAMVATEEMDYQAVLPHSISVSDGEEYTVVYNGTEYKCVCTFYIDGNGRATYMLGNMMAFGGEDTGEPFLVLVFPYETAAMTGVPGGVVPFDGNTEFTLAILGMVEKVVPIPAEYLPPAVVLHVANNKYLYKTADTSNSENLLIAPELEALVKSGRTIYLYFEEDGGRTYVAPTQIGIASEGGVITVRYADGGSTTVGTFFAPNAREI